jgi:hypothetical protein
MLVRDGRNVVHNLGARNNGSGITSMKVLAGAGSDGSGGWTSRTMGQTYMPRQPRDPSSYRRDYPTFTMAAPCLECGQQGEVKSKLARYCSTTCRNKAAKRAQRERQKAVA